MAGFFEELKRRKVIRVFVAYIIASWLLLQVADVLSSVLALPDWAPKLVFFLLVVGLVPALILAWAYQITPDGIKTDSERRGSSPPDRLDVTLDPVGSIGPNESRVPGMTINIDGHQVRMADFFIDRYEVTNREYQAFVDASGYEKGLLGARVCPRRAGLELRRRDGGVC